MYFDDEFIKSLPDDWAHAIVKIADKFNTFMNVLVRDEEKHFVAEEVLFLLQIFCRKKGLAYQIPTPFGNPTEIRINAMKIIRSLYEQAENHIKRQSVEKRQEHYKNVFEIAFEGAFHYEFSEGDLKRIQLLINELRELISSSVELEPRHKRRVLGKLEKLQSELHKRVSDLDSFYGSLIELSITARTVGENFKPIVDRIREIVSIVWPVQARTFDLPSDTPFELPGQSEKDKT